MYSAVAIQVMKQRATPLPDHPVLADLFAERLDAAEQRLIAERDPDRRAALRAADAQRRTQAAQAATSVMTKMASAMKISSVMKKMTSPLKRITKSVFSRLSAIMERRRAEREARRVSFRDVVARIEAATNYPQTTINKPDEIVTVVIGQVVGSSITAMAPPAMSVRASVSHLVAA